MSSPGVDEDREAQEDAALMRDVLQGDKLDRLLQDEADDTIKKAEGAIDYADIDDDDLAEDEDELRPPVTSSQRQFELSSIDLPGPGKENGVAAMKLEDALGAENLDELFGDTSSSPTDEFNKLQGRDGAMSYNFEEDEIFGEPIGSVQDGSTSMFAAADNLPSSDAQIDGGFFGSDTKVEPVSEDLLRQQELFARSRAAYSRTAFPAPTPENEEEALALMWPKFRKNSVPKFMELMPPKKARYVGKTPVKPPKPVQPTKVSLDIEADQEKAFKLSSGPQKRKYDSQKDIGLVPVQLVEDLDEDSDPDDDDSDFENNPVGGKTWRDLQVICADWELESPPLAPAEVDDDEDLFADSMMLDRVAGNAPKVRQNSFERN